MFINKTREILKFCGKNLNLNANMNIRLMKISQQYKHNNIHSHIPKFNFARKTNTKDKNNMNKNNKEIELVDNENLDFDNNEDNRESKQPKKTNTPKTINIIQQEVPIRISPYFSKAVSEREKSAAYVSVANLVEEEKKAGRKSVNDEELNILKQKIAAARKQYKKGRKIGMVVENIKRELPKEL
jgi:hypothetical protein